MKNIKEFINESMYRFKDAQKIIDEEIKTYSKKMLMKMADELKDDLEEQDNFIEENDKSLIWQFICNCAKVLKAKPKDLWVDCGGSHMFADAISKYINQ